MTRSELLAFVVGYLRRLMVQRSAPRWAAEIAGVIVVAIAASMVYTAAGVAVVGVYLLLIANTGGE